MKNKIIIAIIAMITGVLIGIVIKSKIDYKEPNSVYQVENISDELKMLEAQVKVNDEILSDLKNKLEYLKLFSDEQEYQEHLKLELNKYKKLSCSTDIKGEGIEIKLSDSKDAMLMNTNFGIVHDIDIINILNDLKTSGAEAISINDIRIVENSDVQCGGPVVRINGIPKAVPFVIKAIGDKEKLYAGLYDTSGYLKILEDVYKVDIEIIKRDRIFIPKRVMWC